jgi:hypothetical protein
VVDALAASAAVTPVTASTATGIPTNDICLSNVLC